MNTDDMHEKLLQLENRIMKKIIELIDIVDPQNKKLRDYETQFVYKNLPLPITTTQQIETNEKNDIIAGNLIEKTRELDLEILKKNNTIIDGDYGRTFVFYWRIYDIQKTMTEKDVFINSPNFYFKGKVFRKLFFSIRYTPFNFFF